MKKGFFKRYGSASVNKKDQTKPTPGNEQDNKSTGMLFRYTHLKAEDILRNL